VPQKPKWQQRLAAHLIHGTIQLAAATLRFHWHDESGVAPPTGCAIYCIWHNRLALSMPMYFRFLRPRQPRSTLGLAALVSASKDGGFLSAVLECFGVQPVRGSSSRRGPQALLELTTWAERGYDLALTPDGPRGPRYVVQEGVMSLAQITGLPVYPCCFNVSRKVCLKSWDQFQIPMPFARCEMILGKPLCIPREATDAERNSLRLELESRLKQMTKD
jgi:lysophospholipid acyltransferase (LPLAT)-like uncharacterized protein